MVNYPTVDYRHPHIKSLLFHRSIVCSPARIRFRCVVVVVVRQSVDKCVSKGLGRSTKSRSLVCHKVLSIGLSSLDDRSGGDCPLLGDIGSPSVRRPKRTHTKKH